MAHSTTMVREYASQEEFSADARKLGVEGWSADTTVNPYEKLGMLQRMLARFARKQAPVTVTYTRQRPS